MMKNLIEPIKRNFLASSPSIGNKVSLASFQEKGFFVVAFPLLLLSETTVSTAVVAVVGTLAVVEAVLSPGAGGAAELPSASFGVGAEAAPPSSADPPR